MDFAPDPRSTTFERSATAFAREHLQAPARASERFDRRGWSACVEFGLFAMPVDEAHGGLDADLATCVDAMRALARESCQRGGLLFAASAHLGGVVLPLARLGDDEQRSRYLPDLISGACVAGMPLVESNADHAEGVETALRATAGSQGFALEGTVPAVCNAMADLFLVWADTGALVPGAGSKPADGAYETAFLVPRTTPGLSIAPHPEAQGLVGAELAALRFSRVQLSASAMLGPLHRGIDARRASFCAHSSLALAYQLGRMERQLMTALGHANTREQFGRSIGSFQAISHRLADMKTRLELARLLVHRLAWTLDRGEDAVLDAAMARSFVTQGFIESSRATIQIHGGHGYMSEAGFEHDLGDAMTSHVYLGASEAPRDIIAFRLGLGGYQS